jgi:ribose-phosphate pyrophosphokinase
MSDMMLFSGNANRELAQKIAEHLNRPLGAASVRRFSDGEIHVEILENVRGRDVFIIQSTCAPTNDHLMELLLLTDALRRASAIRITAVIPYFGYARQDRRVRNARVPISAKVVADMISSVGIDRVLTVDLHADQIQGFFYMPVDNLYATPVFVQDLIEHRQDPMMIISPDIGGVVRARAFAKYLDCDLAIIDKRRPQPNEAKIMNIIGEVHDRNCVIIDDMIDTAGTLSLAAQALKEQGAAKVIAYCTHPVFSGAALKNLAHNAIDEIVVSDTIPLVPEIVKMKKVRQISLSGMLSEGIRRISEEESISSMFPES